MIKYSCTFIVTVFLISITLFILQFFPTLLHPLGVLWCHWWQTPHKSEVDVLKVLQQQLFETTKSFSYFQELKLICSNILLGKIWLKWSKAMSIHPKSRLECTIMGVTTLLSIWDWTSWSNISIVHKFRIWHTRTIMQCICICAFYL